MRDPIYMAGLLAVTIVVVAVSACGGSDSPMAAAPVTVTETETVTQAPATEAPPSPVTAPKPKPIPKPKPRPKPAPRVVAPTPKPKPAASPDARRLAQFRAYLHENFGGQYGPAVSWYSNIKRIELAGSSVYIYTNIYPDSDADQPASAMCTAALFSDTPKFDQAYVMGSTETILKQCP